MKKVTKLTRLDLTKLIKKSILVVMMSMIGTISNAQFVVDTAEARLLSLERITNDLNDKNIILMNNLENYQKQRKRGIEYLVEGLVMSSIGATFLLATKQGGFSTVCLVSGSVGMLVGHIILIDSGKWITGKKRVRKGLPKPETTYEELIIDK